MFLLRNVYKKSMNCIALQVYFIIFVLDTFGNHFVNTKSALQNCIAIHFEAPDKTEPLAEKLKAYFLPIVNKVHSVCCPLPLQNLLKNQSSVEQSNVICFQNVLKICPKHERFGLFYCNKPKLYVYEN